MINYMTESEYGELIETLTGKGDMPTIILEKVTLFLEDLGIKHDFSAFTIYKGSDSDWRLVLYYKNEGDSLIRNHELLDLKSVMTGTKHGLVSITTNQRINMNANLGGKE